MASLLAVVSTLIYHKITRRLSDVHGPFIVRNVLNGLFLVYSGPNAYWFWVASRPKIFVVRPLRKASRTVIRSHVRAALNIHLKILLLCTKNYHLCIVIFKNAILSNAVKYLKMRSIFVANLWCDALNIIWCDDQFLNLSVIFPRLLCHFYSIMSSARATVIGMGSVKPGNLLIVFPQCADLLMDRWRL